MSPLDNPAANLPNNQVDSPQDSQLFNPLANQVDSQRRSLVEFLQISPAVNLVDNLQRNHRDSLVDNLQDNQRDSPLSNRYPPHQCNLRLSHLNSRQLNHPTDRPHSRQ